jgi:histidinol-phosphatase (PHP family)
MHTDFHLHTDFSGDSTTPMVEMIERGIAMGIKIMCFTEHMDLDYIDCGLDFELDTLSYYNKFLELKEHYKSQITLLFGVELGLQPHLTSLYEELTTAYPFDFIIGSSHLVNHQDPYYPEFFQSRGEQQGFDDYFQSVLDNLKAFSNFDVYGHLDYIVRYSPNQNKYFSYNQYKEILDEILNCLIEKGIGLECNTSGLKYGLGHPHPNEDILGRYRQLGGEILTVGSDAHAPAQIGYEFSRIRDLLISCGFQYYTIFRERKPEFIKL